MLVVKYVEPWARGHQQRWHSEALQTFGERVVIRHRWNIRDYALGRVGRCTSCAAGVRLNEKQRVRVADSTGGTFTLTFAGQTTAAIQWDASATELQAALVALDVNNLGDIVVTGTSINDLGLIVEFLGQWAFTVAIPSMTSTSSLTNGSVEVVQIQAGTGGTNVQSRVTAIYKQAGESWCIECYGVGFEGGYEPIVYVTWALITDSQNETTRTPSGVMQKEDPQIQFSFEPMVEEFDLMSRVETWEDDNVTPRSLHARYTLREVRPETVRTGPGTPDETINLMPEEFRTAYQIPSNEWVVGQVSQIEVLPFEDVKNLVPLTRAEERLVELGITERRRWFQRVDATSPFEARETHP